MNRVKGIAIASALALAVCTVAAQEADRKVAGGGITAKGWQGKVDAAAAKEGKTHQRLEVHGDGWRPAHAGRTRGGLLESREHGEG